ncbi:transposase [Pedobacter suwonensis]|uniref:transposase n=1 Tax=Pedobacter suwonensis TaxID=332999 RepID=UPI0037C8ADF9
MKAKALEKLMDKELFIRGLNNMKNKLFVMERKMLLKKRGLIESVSGILKTVCIWDSQA